VKTLARVLALTLILGPALLAEAPRPASVLVFPVQHHGNLRVTLLSVTNTNMAFNGSTNALYQYVTARCCIGPRS